MSNYSNSNKYLNLFDCCRITIGIKRSVIIDTQRRTYYFIPNDLARMLKKYDRYILNKICVSMELTSLDIKTFNEYIDFLIKKELIFLTNNLLPFVKISTNVNYPYEIQNVIIDFKDNMKINLHNVLEDLEGLNAEDIQFRIYNNSNYFLKRILEVITNYSFEHIEVLLNYENGNLYQNLRDIVDNFTTITFLLYGVPSQLIPEENYKQKIFFFNYELKGKEMCGVVNPSYFNTNLYHILEGQNHNTCLRGKVSIDEAGFLKNCPSFITNYGKYSTDNLYNMIKDDNYKKYHSISKKNISNCKKCEFRDMCTDCRAYLKNSDDIYSTPLKCTYNPYTCEWSK